MKWTLIVCVLLLTTMSCSDDSVDEIIDDETADDVITEDPAASIDFSEPIRGINWADDNDNFVDGLLVPSGLTKGDSYQLVQNDANYIVKGFINNMSANTIRLPVNYETTSSTWWKAYKGAIDKAISKGMRVILAYWEGESEKDGMIDNSSEFWLMWDEIIEDYGDNNGVYYEVINEPYGYTLTELTELYEEWLENYPDISDDHILLGGEGYSEDVTGIGADSRFEDCLLSLHNYAFWAERSTDEWYTDWLERIGDYASRTVVTEFGATMTQGKDYSFDQGGDNEIDYIQVSTSLFNEYGVQSVYWAGLKDGDWYSIQTFDVSSYTMTTTNESGLYWIQYGWGLSD